MARRKQKREHGFLTVRSLSTLRTPNDERFELWKGNLVLQESAGFEHSTSGVQLIIKLAMFVEMHDLGAVCGPDAEYILERDPDTVLMPDVSFIAHDRVPKRVRSRIEGPPDLAVEIMSPSNSFPEMQRKAACYLQAGCRLVWIIRPSDRHVFVLHPDGSEVEYTGDDTISGEDVVPGFTFRAHDLFWPQKNAGDGVAIPGGASEP